MTQPVRFRQNDLDRAMRVWEKRVGSPPAGVRIWPDGSFALLTTAEAKEKPLTPLEQWERDHGDRAA